MSEKRVEQLVHKLREEIAIYRRDEQECFKVCGPSDEPKTQRETENQTHGQVASNHADRLDLLLEEFLNG